MFHSKPHLGLANFRQQCQQFSGQNCALQEQDTLYASKRSRWQVRPAAAAEHAGRAPDGLDQAAVGALQEQAHRVVHAAGAAQRRRYRPVVKRDVISSKGKPWVSEGPGLQQQQLASCCLKRRRLASVVWPCDRSHSAVLRCGKDDNAVHRCTRERGAALTCSCDQLTAAPFCASDPPAPLPLRSVWCSKLGHSICQPMHLHHCQVSCSGMQAAQHLALQPIRALWHWRETWQMVETLAAEVGTHLAKVDEGLHHDGLRQLVRLPVLLQRTRTGRPSDAGIGLDWTGLDWTGLYVCTALLMDMCCTCAHCAISCCSCCQPDLQS